jgi:hypothetical protein
VLQEAKAASMARRSSLFISFVSDPDKDTAFGKETVSFRVQLFCNAFILSREWNGMLLKIVGNFNN